MSLYTALIYNLWNFESLPVAFIHPPCTGVKLFWIWQDIFYNDQYLLLSMQMSKSGILLQIAYI